MDMIAAQALAGRVPDHLELIYPDPAAVLARLEFCGSTGFPYSPAAKTE